METTLLDQSNKSLVSFKYIIWGLVFLFPLLAVSVKSWTSTLQLLLALVSLAWLINNYGHNKFEMSAWVKLFLIILPLSFLWYLTSEFLNGWQDIKPHWPLIDIRYVLILPIFLAIKNFSDVDKWLLKGAIFGCMLAALYTVYQAYYLQADPPIGAYHHLFLGPASGAMSLLILYSKPHRLQNPVWRYLAYGGILCGLTALVLSTARSGFLATLVLLALFPLLTGHLSVKRLITYLFTLIVLAVTIYALSDSVRTEAQDTVKGFKSHFQQLSLTTEEFHRSQLDNVTIRFELWRTALEISRNNLLVGVGRTGYPKLLQEMLDKGEAHPGLGVIDQPHNAYLYHLVTRGIIGLILFIGILLVPLIIFFSYRKKAESESILGIVWVLFFSIVSLTQSSVFARGHYLSFFLVILTILLASCIRRADKAREVSG